METVVDRAAEFDMDHPYRAAECRIDLAAASPKSDVYSLAAIMLNWITGESPPQDDNWLPDPLIDTRKDLGEELAQTVEQVLWQALALEPADRPTAAEIASFLTSWQVSQAEAAKAVSHTKENGSTAREGRYEILETLGKGGTAETFLARDTVRDELVVLKRLMRPDIHGYLATAEFKALNRLRHPCLPTLIEVYSADDPYHLKFEYREGKSLKDTWRELRSATPETKHRAVLRIATDVLDALSYLHDNGTLHRDVTPGNILLPEDEASHVLLIDLGLASPVSDAVSRVGTPLYLAPEVEQSTPQWSAACDIYGLGVLLFELLADRLPFRTEGAKRFKDELIQPPTTDHPLSDLLCKLLLEKACWPVAEQRFKNAVAMKLAIVQVYNQYQHKVDTEKSDKETTEGPSQENKEVAPQELSKQTNSFVTQLRQAFRNSSLGNANNRGMDNDFSRNTYVRTELDDILLPDILDGKWNCVALSGNPGDGKTAFLEEVRRALLNGNAKEIECNAAGWRIQANEREFVAVYDASESHEGQSSDDLLKAAIAPLKGRTKPDVAYTVLLAINDGRLQDLITAHRLSFRWLCDSIRKQMESNSKDDDVLLIDLKHRAPIADSSKNRSLFLGLLDAFVKEENWQVCASCSASQDCSIRANATALRHDRPREQLVQLLAGVYFLAERRPTIRDLRSSLAWIITGDRGCSEVHANERSVSDERYYNLAFDLRAGEDLVINSFQNLDPDRVPSPQLERQLSRPNPEALFDSSPVIHPTIVSSSKKSLRDLKRRYYFEFIGDDGRNPSPNTLLPARMLKSFLSVVADRSDLKVIKKTILNGLRKLDRIPGHAIIPEAEDLDILALRLDSHDDDLFVIRQWSGQQFELYIQDSPDQFLNYLPDQIILRHISGWPELQIGLQMFELLARAVDGTTPDAMEHQSLIMDFQRFRAQLLTSPTKDVILLTPGGERSSITCEGGVITRTSGAIS